MPIGAIFIALLLYLIAASAHADDPKNVGFSSTGNYGIHRLPMPVAPSKHLSLSGYAGYGLTESMGSVSGVHHRIQGSVSVAGAPIKQLGMHLTVDGYHDRHPKDHIDKDTTNVGVPRFGIHGGHRLGSWVQLGGALDVIIPGKSAPSLEFSATTLEPRLLLAVAPDDAVWRMLLCVGYRWDNTHETAPERQSLRPGDRISLGTSEYDSVLLGLGGSVSISDFEIVGEVSSNIYVGNPPSGSSAVRLNIGVKYHVNPRLQTALTTESLLIGRPDVDVNTPIMPVEPRFSVIAGMTYAFGVKFTRKPKVEEPIIEEPIVPENNKTESDDHPITTSIEGQVVDEEGNAIGGTTVRYVTVVDDEEKSFDTTTDSTGSYKLTNLPIGEGTLVIKMDGFDPIEKPLTLSESPMVEQPSILKEVLSSPTQLRGQIRAITGDPIKAKLSIKPGNHTIETDETGYFSIDLPQGKYRIIITAPGRKTQKKRVVIEENSVTIINIDLR